MRLIYNEETWGITYKSLEMLRNELAQRVYHEIAVIEIPTNVLCCGYLILDKTTGEAIWTGDGFRMDKAGEGGAGYKSAWALFDIFGLSSFVWRWDVDPLRYTKLINNPEKVLTELVEEIIQSQPDFKVPAKLRAQYIR